MDTRYKPALFQSPFPPTLETSFTEVFSCTTSDTHANSVHKCSYTVLPAGIPGDRACQTLSTAPRNLEQQWGKPAHTASRQLNFNILSHFPLAFFSALRRKTHSELEAVHCGESAAQPARGGLCNTLVKTTLPQPAHSAETWDLRVHKHFQDISESA